MTQTETPKLTGSVHVSPNTDHLYDALADALMISAKQAVACRGGFHLALSGGSTPRPFYRRLATNPRFRLTPWSETHVWIVDERCVPESDDRSNVKMIRQSLTDHVPLRDGGLHPMPVLEVDPASRYENDLGDVFGLSPTGWRTASSDTIPRLDFVILGIGDDGHTASLFPHSPALSVSNRWIVTNEGSCVTPPPRVTMTFPLLNAARRLAVLVTGKKKAAILERIDRHLQDAGPDAESLPITAIHPMDGDLTWYLDPTAATGQEVNK